MITKSYAKNGQSCRVTFQYSPEREARSAAVLGEFNDWRPEAHPMERRADGTFHLTVSLPAGRRYRFRYLFDGEGWANDETADGYVLNQFGSEDAVLDLASSAPEKTAAGTRTKPSAAGKNPKAKTGETTPGKARKIKAGEAAKFKSAPAAKAAPRKAAAPKRPAAPRPPSPAERADTPKPPRGRRAPEAE